MASTVDEPELNGVADSCEASKAEINADAAKEVRLQIGLGNATPASTATKAKSEHIEQFVKYTGMTPRTCYILVLASMILRIMGGCWMGMVAIEYTRYYVINDLAEVDYLRVLTGSPQYAVQALTFPFLGVISDRVSRKKLIVASSISTCASSWLLTRFPSVEVYILTKAMALVSDLGSPIRDAMLRDIFSDEEWEQAQGGVTGLRAKMAVIAQIGFGVAMVVGMGIMKLESLGINLPNEYTLHKAKCGVHYCVHPGHFSWEGDWAVDGSLRLLMILASVVLSIDALLVVFAFPETVRPEMRTSTWALVKQNWRVVAPWNNLRVFATPELRELMSIRCIGYILGAGGGSIFMAFYGRFEFDTFTMMVHTILAGGSTCLVTMLVPAIVVRYGDLKGIWVPSVVLTLAYGFSCALMPSGYGVLVFATWPLLAGPSFALNSFAPDLMAKLIPGDVQGTFQTAKSFTFRLSNAIFMWPWNQLYMHTMHLSYPLDATCVWVSIAVGFLILFLTLRLLRRDPKENIEQGRALEAFMASPYAQSHWYRQHCKESEDMEAKDIGSNFTAAKQAQQLDLVHTAAVLTRERGQGNDDNLTVEASPAEDQEPKNNADALPASENQQEDL
eukprot:CAMPEP_0197660472 /NCGR_PEP_ID=MMETSP1338-20131121/50862_1 /TAXON_ID=43686 ORGANISM="Pelagodinium beii, Strain RCC1491" /NCGR_SAMPLE_ID=MMETSP1338 /ASSEMBLY_ACC=CAM_ASM_000754 /LENGTH=617 /DNA_ID=CAMNT_0043237825 /DNA_START=38 /DNA_END=1891 /DNA_ORIENTATION=-